MITHEMADTNVQTNRQVKTAGLYIISYIIVSLQIVNIDDQIN